MASVVGIVIVLGLCLGVVGMLNIYILDHDLRVSVNMVAAVIILMWLLSEQDTILRSFTR